MSMADPYDLLNESDIIARLERDRKVVSSGTDSATYDDDASWAPPRPAAVLIPLIRMPIESGGPGWHILYTRRTDLVEHHKGQVSFPGGRRDPGDSSPEATALREACEEIGLNPADVHILGRMDDFLTVSNYRVTPVVGTMPWPYPLTLSPNEVSRVFTVPVDWLADS
ncbi:MAG: CoA pyrophosphatase, partial [Syntrophales bacterium]|nr:CoA pyrophosphatase [Syntrophales bacterium]